MFTIHFEVVDQNFTTIKIFDQIASQLRSHARHSRTMPTVAVTDNVEVARDLNPKFDIVLLFAERDVDVPEGITIVNVHDLSIMFDANLDAHR